MQRQLKQMKLFKLIYSIVSICMKIFYQLLFGDFCTNDNLTVIQMILCWKRLELLAIVFSFSSISRHSVESLQYFTVALLKNRLLLFLQLL